MTGTRDLPLPERYDLGRSLRVLALGDDPTARVGAAQVWWATRTPDGPAALRLSRDGGRLRAQAWGAGAGWVLDRAHAIAGLTDDPADFADVARRHPVVARVARELGGVRMVATGRAFQASVPMILQQKVTGLEAKRAHSAMVRRLGEPAPGPAGVVPAGLRLPPDPAVLAATPYWAFHPWGVEQKRADTIRRAAASAAAIDRAGDAAGATRRLVSIPGIGPWTAAETVRVAFGDPDVVTVGDYHLPHLVCWALAGEPRGTDERMLELLAPFAGHRGRVVTLLALAGLGAPKFGPRMPIRSFARY
ncbi:DNA-3-methyladenine glycosylase 2 family protein [Luedemannella helvata]|uniref:3-methyladenine DNA glycosylase n=1 Tax=Luedemannella helvata TaxID=349315 RepID=A0ABP4XDV0_9ACTN